MFRRRPSLLRQLTPLVLMVALLAPFAGPAPSPRATAGASAPALDHAIALGRATLTENTPDGEPVATRTRYESPLSFSISWPRPWSVQGSDASYGLDVVTLSDHRGTVFQLWGIMEFGGNARSCLTFLSTAYGTILNGDRLQRGSGSQYDAVGPGDDIAWGTWSFRSDTFDRSQDSQIYIGCQTLVPGQSVMAMAIPAGRDVFADNVDAVDQLLDDRLTIAPENDVPDDFDQQVDDQTTGISRFYRQAMRSAGYRYRAPDISHFDDIIHPPCTQRESDEPIPGNQSDEIDPSTGPFYCPRDATIYVDAPWLSTYLLPRGGAVVIAGVLAHESGHALQDQTGWSAAHSDDAFDAEQQADCLSGAYLHDAVDRGDFAESDAASYRDVIFGAGGSEGGVGHGTGDERVAAINLGYDDGFDGCGLFD